MNSLLEEMSILIALYKDYIGTQNDAKYFDSNRHAEYVLAGVLTQLGDWGKMVVLDWEKPNFPAIDLRSENGAIGVQITSEKSGDKVAETLTKFNRYAKGTKTLYILMLRGRQTDYKSANVVAAVKASRIPFSVDNNIVDLDFLRQLADKKNDADATEAAIALLKQVFGDWAIDVLTRHRSAGKKLLSLFTEHGLHATQILDLLGAQKSLPLASAYETMFLNSHITDEVLRNAADEFRVPYDWLAGTSPLLGEIGLHSHWRGFGATFDTIKKVLGCSLDQKATICVVTPLEVDDFFQRIGSTPVHNKIREFPILVYSTTTGKFGNVFTHLGIQPGEVEHHRQAAWFLFAYIRRYGAAARGSYSLSCRWERWPREKIIETVDSLLLVQARRTVDAQSYQEAYDVGDGFPGHPGWEQAYRDYAQLLETNLQKLETDNIAAFHRQIISLDEEIEGRLPPESPDGIRVFGAEALRLALKCNIPIKVLRPDASEPVDMDYETAAEEFLAFVQNRQKEGLYEAPTPPTVFYVDVVPAIAVSATHGRTPD
jgi:transcriptional regulator with XRE-family HTH domain